MAVLSRCPRRDSPRNIQIKIITVYYDFPRINNMGYDGTESIQIGKMENLRIVSKVFPNRYDKLVILILDEFDFIFATVI